jgi:hypothetical protein
VEEATSVFDQEQGKDGAGEPVKEAEGRRLLDPSSLLIKMKDGINGRAGKAQDPIASPEGTTVVNDTVNSPALLLRPRDDLDCQRRLIIRGKWGKSFRKSVNKGRGHSLEGPGDVCH